MSPAPVPRPRRGSPGFLEPPAPKPPKPPKPLSMPARVQAFVDAHPGRWFASREIAEQLGITIARTNDALCVLCDRGAARRSLPATGRKNVGQTYSTTKI